jgi:hypothetical protein
MAAYINSIVLLRGTLPVDFTNTSSDFTVRGVSIALLGVFGGEDVWDEKDDSLFVFIVGLISFVVVVVVVV